MAEKRKQGGISSPRSSIGLTMPAHRGKNSTARRKKASRNKPRSLLFVRIAGAAVVIALLAAGINSWNWVRDNRLPALKGNAEVYVTRYTTTEDVIAQIKSQTGIRHERALRKVFQDKKVEQYITAGHYSIKASDTNVYIARMLNNHYQSPVKLSLTPALRLKTDIARSVSAQLQLDSIEVAKALNSKNFLLEYGVTPTTVLSLFMPDTYEVWWDCTVDELFDKLKREYDLFWNEQRQSSAKAMNLSVEQVNILASIVCRESNYVGEYRQIAGVYLNRYRRGMKLQADPTIAYCFDYKLTRILKKHLAVNSSYNTYRYAGLPPGPIGPPSKTAIDAVLEADTSSGYIYFCASPKLDGTHVFAKSYSQHRKNAEAFRKAVYGK